MNKNLLASKADLDAWLSELMTAIPSGSVPFYNLEEFEAYFGIQLLDSNGQDFDTYEDLATDTSPPWICASPIAYRVGERSPYYEGPGLPQSYPCMVVSWLGNDEDRGNDVRIRGISYVYPSEFETPTF